MISVKDIYSSRLEIPLSHTHSKYHYGKVTLRYSVRQVTDVSNLESKLCYRIMCSATVSIPNQNPYSLTPSKITQYQNYPALLRVNSSFGGSSKGKYDPLLLDYSPRTLNANISTSANHSDGSNKSYSAQHTTGSSTSQTNTFGVNVSVGFMGDVPTGSVGGDYSHSTTNTQEHSDTTGSESGTNHEAGTSDSISVKDWGSYASLDVNGQFPSWVWGQEYPWDIIQYRSCPSGNNVELPAFVLERLADMAVTPPVVYPPSQLSLFGIDFTMKSSWQVELPADLEDQQLEIEHVINYLSASHGLDEKNNLQVSIVAAPTDFTIKSPSLDLTLLGLEPITHGSPDNGAVVGFVAKKFLVPPVNGAPFKILSGKNNLQVTGQGFDAPMTTSFDKGPVTLSVYFKSIDDIYQYTLFLKHWVSGPGGCTLSFVFNDDASSKIERTVTDMEGEGGANNLLELNMRNKDFASIDYHDYLQLGLNKIDITIKPTASGTKYVLKAAAIGEL